MKNVPKILDFMIAKVLYPNIARRKIGCGKQVYNGHGNPNTLGIVPEAGVTAALYYNLNTPGETWWWHENVWI